MKLLNIFLIAFILNTTQAWGGENWKSSDAQWDCYGKSVVNDKSQATSDTGWKYNSFNCELVNLFELSNIYFAITIDIPECNPDFDHDSFKINLYKLPKGLSNNDLIIDKIDQIAERVDKNDYAITLSHYAGNFNPADFDSKPDIKALFIDKLKISVLLTIIYDNKNISLDLTGLKTGIKNKCGSEVNTEEEQSSKQ